MTAEKKMAITSKSIFCHFLRFRILERKLWYSPFRESAFAFIALKSNVAIYLKITINVHLKEYKTANFLLYIFVVGDKCVALDFQKFLSNELSNQAYAQ